MDSLDRAERVFSPTSISEMDSCLSGFLSFSAWASTSHTWHHIVGESMVLHSERSTKMSQNWLHKQEEKQLSWEGLVMIRMYRSLFSNALLVFSTQHTLSDSSRKYFLIAFHFLTILSNAGISVSHECAR